MRCVECGWSAVSERSQHTVQGYRRFRCRTCGKQFNERSTGLLNRTQYPSDVIALVVLWRLRYKLSLRDLAEMFLIRGIDFSYEAVRDCEAKLTPAMAEAVGSIQFCGVHYDARVIASSSFAGRKPG
jgi:putative transposase